jgi:histidinol phosphatase-like PHP family hydrolase
MTEKINIMAATTFLPISLRGEYDQLWSDKRMQILIEAAIKHQVALEITQYYQQPQPRFIRMAKAAGVKFTFGTNGRTEQEVGVMPYCTNIARECGLVEADFWHPRRDISTKEVFLHI